MNLHLENRKRLIEGSSGGLFVFTGYDAMQLSGDMQAPFLQEGTFWRLTGIEEPGWKLLIDSSRASRATLFRPDRSEIQTIFEGGLSNEEALAISGAQEVLSVKDFEQVLRQVRRNHTVAKILRHSDHSHFVHNPALGDLTKLLERIFVSLEDCTRLTQELRAIKQPEELRRIRQAIKYTIRAFDKAKQSIAVKKYEYEVEAEFDFAFRSNNLHHAYHPIVAGGANSCTLHYEKNSAPLNKKQAVLIDIGARFEGYSADITRTYCMTTPTKRLAAVHAAVEKAHYRCIELLGPNLSVAEYMSSVDDIMKDALQEVGLLADRSDEHTYRKYFPHSISHGLGVDTHDPLGAPRYFKPGMVLTVEPGIYIPEEGIGVRIEDDILITDDGHENLSAALSTKLL